MEASVEFILDLLTRNYLAMELNRGSMHDLWKTLEDLMMSNGLPDDR